MSRPVRIESPDAVYHVTARGDRREDIFEDDADRQMFFVYSRTGRYPVQMVVPCLVPDG